MPNDPDRVLAIEGTLAEAFSAGFASAVEAMTGDRPTLSIQERVGGADEEAPDTGNVFWWEQPLSHAPDAALWVGAPEDTWTHIGGQALAAAGIEAPSNEDVLQTYQELLQQGLSALASALGSRIGQEVTCGEGQRVEKAPQPGLITLGFGGEAAESQVLRLAFSGALVESLETVRPEPPQGAGNRLPSASASGSVELTGGATEAMALLLDVELPVSVSFGRAHIPLKDVLKLASGSIVELNRTVAQPVEVIVNNCVIARGEVVVVDGNYGVRVRQIISRRERLRTLN